ncbi:MAG: hypothetical protein QM762_12870 [Chryseolinea sp.]
MLRKLKKARLDHDTRYCSVSYSDISDDQNDERELNPSGKNRRAHDDLFTAFKGIAKEGDPFEGKGLLVHLIVLCEQFSFTEIEDNPALLEKFKLTGYTIGGSDEHEGVTLIGQRLLENNQILNLVSPFTKLHSDHTNYLYAGSLDAALKEAMQETDLYIGGKHAPDSQLNLFDQPDEKPKRGRKPKAKTAEESEDEGAEEDIDAHEVKMAVNH